MTSVIVSSLAAAAVIPVTLAAIRFEIRERARIDRHRRLVIYRDARAAQDRAWRNYLAQATPAVDEMPEREFGDILGVDHAAVDPVDALWAEHEEPLRLIEGGVLA